MLKRRRNLADSPQPITTWDIPMRDGSTYSIPLFPASEGQHPQPDWSKLPPCRRCQAGEDMQRRGELTGGILPIMRRERIHRTAPNGESEMLDYGWTRWVAACSCPAGGARRRINSGMAWYDDSPAALPGLGLADLAALYVWVIGDITLEDANEQLARSQPAVAARIRVAMGQHMARAWDRPVDLKARAAGGDE